MYRAIALYALQNNLFSENKLDEHQLIDNLNKIDVRFLPVANGTARIALNGTDVESEIRQMNVSEKVSTIAAIPEVREKLVQLQQDMAAGKGVVMDGRDIGTHVIPDAEVKLFMTARPEVRARRRFDELTAKGETVTYEAVLENLRQRDEMDSNRKTNPLRKADDAIEFDNSDIGLEDQFGRVLKIIESVIQRP